MATIKTCDHCGKQSDDSYENKKNRHDWLEFKQSEYAQTKIVNGNFDFCPDCLRTIDDFLREFIRKPISK